MSGHGLRTAALLGATISAGLGAGVYDLYAHTIMPGLRSTDDRTFVTAFQAIDRAIVNPWFIGGSFLGGLALTALAAYTNRDDGAVPWIAASLAGQVLVTAITVAVHLPLNDALKAAGTPTAAEAAAVLRSAFHEQRWVAWNAVRAALSTASFASLAWALAVHGEA